MSVTVPEALRRLVTQARPVWWLDCRRVLREKVCSPQLVPPASDHCLVAAHDANPDAHCRHKA